MGVAIAVKGSKHICPMVEGTKPHVGGPVSEVCMTGVLINGIPVAVVGDKCTCTGGSSPDEITLGCSGVFINGKELAIVGSMTQHGGVIIEGVAGVTVSGGFQIQMGNEEKPEPRIFNLQWRATESGNRISRSEIEEKVILSADTVGYEEGEKVKIQIRKNGDEGAVDEVEGTVRNGRVEVEWVIKRTENNE